LSFHFRNLLKVVFNLTARCDVFTLPVNRECDKNGDFLLGNDWFLADFVGKSDALQPDRFVPTSRVEKDGAKQLGSVIKDSIYGRKPLRDSLYFEYDPHENPHIRVFVIGFGWVEGL
jgi:hypothetical protein